MNVAWEQLWGRAQSLMEDGGPLMVPLVLLGMALWYGLGWRWVSLRRGGRLSLERWVSQGLQGSGPSSGVVGRAVRRGCELRRASGGDLERRLDEAWIDFHVDLERGAALVRSAVVAAPLLGLLGTVTGMIETFDALAEGSLHSASGGIAGGISEALLTTQLGLAVAIPGLVLGRLLVRRQRALEGEIERVRLILLERAP